VKAAVPEWEEEPVKDTESKAHYKDLHAKRPICNKIADTLKVNHAIRYSRWMAKYEELVAKLEIWMAKLEKWVAKVERWAAKFGKCMAKSQRRIYCTSKLERRVFMYILYQQ
jgi:hypothetical protein